MALKPILDANGLVVNIVRLNEIHDWTPPEGHTIGPEGGEIGDTWNGSVYVRPPVPEVVLTLEDYKISVQWHIDTTAQARGYDNGLSLLTYLDDPNPAWAAEALTFKAWRSQVWAYVFTAWEEVQSGLSDPPTLDQLIEELPDIVWPS